MTVSEHQTEQKVPSGDLVHEALPAHNPWHLKLNLASDIALTSQL